MTTTLNMQDRLEDLLGTEHFQNGMRGMMWPTSHNEDDDHGWVSKVDDPEGWSADNGGAVVCEEFDSDEAAMMAMLEILIEDLPLDALSQLVVGWAVPAGCEYPYPYIDVRD